MKNNNTSALLQRYLPRKARGYHFGNSMLLLFLLPLICLMRGASATESTTNDPYAHPSMLLESSMAETVNSNYYLFTESEQKRNFVSATLGSNMVLQQGRPVVLWGFANVVGAMIVIEVHNLGLDGKKYTTKASEDPSEHGIWRFELPPQPATILKSQKPARFNISCPSTGQNAELTNILFGDVYLCGGQSNMEFSIPATTNATKEAQKADHENYSHIRLFTVGKGTSSNDLALDDLQTILQPWTVASPTSLAGPSGFAYFSSVCWFFGKELSDGLSKNGEHPKIPIGLISNNWGGTSVKLWVPGGKLYNAMIHPYLKGPMALSGFTWYQGEADTHSKESAEEYAIDFAYLIQTWKEQFVCPNKQCYFGFVQLSTWCMQNEAIPWMRQAQMEVLDDEKNIGYATNADHGAGCNIHPPSKQYCGARLGRSALALQYGKSIHWKSPSYDQGRAVASKVSVVRNNPAEIHDHETEIHGGSSSSLRVSTTGRTTTKTTATTVEILVELLLKDVASSDGLYLLDEPYNLMDGSFDCSQQLPGICAYPQILLNDDNLGWVNATIEIAPTKPSGVIFRAVIEQQNNNEEISRNYGVFEKQQERRRLSTDLKAVATSYGWGSVPMMTLYDAQTHLPVLPWKEIL